MKKFTVFVRGGDWEMGGEERWKVERSNKVGRSSKFWSFYDNVIIEFPLSFGELIISFIYPI